MNDMKYEVKISETARNDIFRISEFLKDKFSGLVAVTYASKLDDTFLLLKRNPLIGRIHKGKIRRYIFNKKTVVFYCVESNTVNVVRVFDSRKNWSLFF